MSHALRERLALRPGVTFGPFRFLEALPWMVLAAAFRVLAFGSPGLAIVFITLATIAVLNAFIVVTQRSIELTGGQSGLGELSFAESFRLSLTILRWTVPLMVLVAFCCLKLAGQAYAPFFMLGIDGMAFAQHNLTGMLWSAVIATLILLMIVEAGRAGQISPLAVGAELLRHGVWLLVGIAALTAGYVALGMVQDLVREVLMQFWRSSPLNQLFKNLIMFIFIFSFAMLRMWLTLLVLTMALKQSYTCAR